MISNILASVILLPLFLGVLLAPHNVWLLLDYVVVVLVFVVVLIFYCLFVDFIS